MKRARILRFTRLEKAILSWFVSQGEDSVVVSQLQSARLKSRDHTGAGLFVYLDYPGRVHPVGDVILDCNPIPGPEISGPELPDGAGSVLYVTDGIPDVLEIFTYGKPFPEELVDFELSGPPLPS